MRLYGYCTRCHRPRQVRLTGQALALASARGGLAQGVCDECEETRLWPVGILSRVSREAYNAVGRARGFHHMTPAEREEAAVSYDQLKGARTR